jgi:predicted DNA binding protein
MARQQNHNTSSRRRTVFPPLTDDQRRTLREAYDAGLKRTDRSVHRELELLAEQTALNIPRVKVRQNALLLLK